MGIDNIPLWIRKNTDTPDFSWNASSLALPAGFTHSRAGNATMYDSTGTMVWAPANMFINSATLATQDVTVVVGQSYTMSAYGTGSVTLSGGASGTWTGTGVGNLVSNVFTPSGTTVTFTVTGSVTTAWLEPTSYDSPHPYTATGASPYYGPRFSREPTTGLVGYLNEKQVSNFNPRSFFSTSTLVSTTITQNAGTDPMGFNKAIKITEAAETSAHNAAPNTGSIGGGVSGIYWTLSVYAKAGTLPYLQLYNTSLFGTTKFANFDLSNGTVSRVENGIGRIEYIVDGWYRCSFSAVSVSVNLARTIYVGLANSPTADRAVSYLGSTDNYLYVWGAQVEKGSFPTSFMPTYAATLTRAADIAPYIALSSFSAFNATEGTFKTTAVVPYSLPDTRSYFFGLDDNTADNVLAGVIGTDGKPIGLNVNATTETLSGDALSVTTPNALITAVRTYKNADNQFKANGSTDSDGTLRAAEVPSLTYLRLGGGIIADRELNGYLMSLKYWDTSDIAR